MKATAVNPKPVVESLSGLEINPGELENRNGAAPAGGSGPKAGRAAPLSDHRLLLRTLIDNLPDCIYAKDTAGRKTLANPADLKNLRCKTEADAIGKTDFDLFPADIAAKFCADDQNVFQGRPVINREEYFFNETGEKRWLLTSKLPLRDQQGAIVGLIGVGRDITAIKEAEARLDQVHSQLVDASRRAGMAEVATSVLHNVGNVLNSVNVSVHLVTDILKSPRPPIWPKSRPAARARVGPGRFHHQAIPKANSCPDTWPNWPNIWRRNRPTALAGTGLAAKKHRAHQGHRRHAAKLRQALGRHRNVASWSIWSKTPAHERRRPWTATMSRSCANLPRSPPMLVDKHKVLQILVNLIRNAKYACDDPADRTSTSPYGVDQRRRIASKFPSSTTASASRRKI